MKLSKDLREFVALLNSTRPLHRIDLLTAIDGVSFAEAWTNRVPAELDGLPVNVLGKVELMRNKQASRRSQDLADVERLSRL